MTCRMHKSKACKCIYLIKYLCISDIISSDLEAACERRSSTHFLNAVSLTPPTPRLQLSSPSRGQREHPAPHRLSD